MNAILDSVLRLDRCTKTNKECKEINAKRLAEKEEYKTLDLYLEIPDREGKIGRFNKREVKILIKD
jgi:hypothetical protein